MTTITIETKVDTERKWHAKVTLPASTYDPELVVHRIAGLAFNVDTSRHLSGIELATTVVDLGDGRHEHYIRQVGA